jgi:O-antigen ligase
MLAGSFNWHNQYGAFCAAGFVVCFVLALTAEPRRLRSVAVFVAAVLATGLLGSASRASVIAAGAACLLGVLFAGRAVGCRLTAERSALVVAASVAVGVFLRSPLFFEQWSWPWAPLVGRTVEAAGSQSYQSLSGNGGARLAFWQAGAGMAGERPVLGHGLSPFGDGSRWYMPNPEGRSADPHNELVRAAAEGGLVGAVPVGAVLVLSLGLAAILLRRHWSRPASTVTDAGAVAALLAAGVLVVHALVDFDWSYPSLTMATGWCLGIAASVRAPPAPYRRAGWLSTAGASALALAVVASLIGAAVASTSRHARAEAAGDPAQSQQVLQAAWSSRTPDHRLAMQAVTSRCFATNQRHRGWWPLCSNGPWSTASRQ